MDEEGALTAAARELSARLLASDPNRLRHVTRVAAQAARYAPTVDPRRRDALIAAAWLHDIGYVPALRDTGFHPVDGARYLRAQGWPDEVCALVAHHSGARYIAAERGIDEVLRDFTFVEDEVTDALTLADQTSGPTGHAVMDLEDRMRDMLDRHGPDSPHHRAHPRRAPYFRAVRERVARRLDTGGPGAPNPV
ncbi:HD domain-containing protein [Gordonia oryzae]|uniref:HD domain-containing protein n=1 Tax=Gordonia oryzae TaxID=2487349 RepID=A0A3N4GVT6_9ACTN|nr:HD domain-containing protein [Gordonia oryzae]RPA64826.1 HD domain-containing protein [Gordonia oryzae]